jgi:hypothetical protein
MNNQGKTMDDKEAVREGKRVVPLTYAYLR